MTTSTGPLLSKDAACRRGPRLDLIEAFRNAGRNKGGSCWRVAAA